MPILAKAVCFHEASEPSFREYCRLVIENAGNWVARLNGEGCDLSPAGPTTT